MYVVAKDNELTNFSEFNKDISVSFSKTLKYIQGMYDTLFNRSFPYMMGIYQNPLHVEEFKDSKLYYPFNVKFFPPLRGENSIKWNASSETCAWAKTNPRIVEETAEELRMALKKYLGSIH